jgi:hypothetical protein
MIYEVQITHVAIDNKGNDKNVKNNLVVQNAISFADAEEAGYEYGQGLNLNEVDVVGVKRSKIKEILNTCKHDDDLIWQAELMDVFHDDEGNEKEIKYKTILFAQSFDSAKAFISEYMRQGYENMSLVSLKLTKFTTVI